MAPSARLPLSTAAFTSIELRAALSQFATGVTVITTLDAQGRPIGFTANSFNSVSLEPPLILWSVKRASSSMPAFEACSRFAVNVLSGEQRLLAERFASKAEDRFHGVAWQVGAGGSPVLEGAASVFECQVRSRYPEGDHVIYVGEVLHCTRRLGAAPLVFWGGRFFGELDG